MNARAVLSFIVLLLHSTEARSTGAANSTNSGPSSWRARAGYGAWISRSNRERDALGRPFVDEPGGSMLYSTGSSHLVSVILSRVTGRSSRELARDRLGALDGFSIVGSPPGWIEAPRQSRTKSRFPAAATAMTMAGSCAASADSTRATAMAGR